MTNNRSPLVSIIVITYNSSKYVLETLDSARNQEYSNLELIISDDSSTDTTVAVCESWIKNNKDFFQRVILKKASKNRGIPGNFNQGIKEAKGEWVKFIAGDDILMPNCISDNLKFALAEGESFVFSLPEILLVHGDSTKKMEIEKKFLTGDNFYKLDAKRQFLHLLIKSYPMSPPTLFFKMADFEKVGYFNEKFTNEDFPHYLKITSSGFRLAFLQKQTVIYRIHSLSISQSNARLEEVSFWTKQKVRKIIKPYINMSLLKKHPLIYWDFQVFRAYVELVLLFGNSKIVGKYMRTLRLLSPIYIKYKLKKI